MKAKALALAAGFFLGVNVAALDLADNHPDTYTVVKGDTLWDIAKIYDGVSVDQLLQLNSGLNNKRLQPGQKIKIQKIS